MQSEEAGIRHQLEILATRNPNMHILTSPHVPPYMVLLDAGNSTLTIHINPQHDVLVRRIAKHQPSTAQAELNAERATHLAAARSREK